MTTPFPERWKVKVPSWVSLPPVPQHGTFVARTGPDLRALEMTDGREAWALKVDPAGGSGHVLHGFGDLVITDRRPDPERTTELVIVNRGKIERTARMDMFVVRGSSMVDAGLLYAAGVDPATGTVLRAVELASGKRAVDVRLPSGGNAVHRVGERLLILNDIATPGLYWLNPDGKNQRTLEERQAHQLALAGGRLAVTLYEGKDSERTLQVRGLASTDVLWEETIASPTVGIDDDSVAAQELRGSEYIPIVREATTGRVRWRGKPLEAEAGTIWSTGDYWCFGHETGVSIYRRAGGDYLGEMELGRTLVAVEDQVYAGGFNYFACCSAV